MARGGWSNLEGGVKTCLPGLTTSWGAGIEKSISDREKSMCRGVVKQASWKVWGNSRNQEGCRSESLRRRMVQCEAGGGVPWSLATWRTWGTRRVGTARMPHVCQTLWIPTCALAIISEVINPSSEAFGFDLGFFHCTSNLDRKTLSVIALTQSHIVLIENDRKWRGGNRRLTADAGRKEGRHFDLGFLSRLPCIFLLL